MKFFKFKSIKLMALILLVISTSVFALSACNKDKIDTPPTNSGTVTTLFDIYLTYNFEDVLIDLDKVKVELSYGRSGKTASENPIGPPTLIPPDITGDELLDYISKNSNNLIVKSFVTFNQSSSYLNKETNIEVPAKFVDVKSFDDWFINEKYRCFPVSAPAPIPPIDDYVKILSIKHNTTEKYAVPAETFDKEYGLFSFSVSILQFHPTAYPGDGLTSYEYSKNENVQNNYGTGISIFYKKEGNQVKLSTKDFSPQGQ